MAKLNEDTDLHFKMCKKVAQLTKVIYHLQSQLEQHDFNVREVAVGYEQQIDEEDAQHDREADHQQVEALESQLSQRDIQLHQLNNQINALQVDHQQALQSLEQRLQDQSRAELDNLTNQLTSKHQDQLVHTTSILQSEFNSQLGQKELHMVQLEQLHSKLEKDMIDERLVFQTEFQKANDLYHSQIEALQAESDTHINALEAEVAAQKETFHQTKSHLETEIERLQNMLDTQASEKHHLKVSESTAQETISALSTRLRALESAVVDRDEQIKELESAKKDLEFSLRKNLQDLDANLKQQQNSYKQSSSQVNTLEQQNQQLMDKCNILMQDLIERQSQISQLHQDILDRESRVHVCLEQVSRLEHEKAILLEQQELVESSQQHTITLQEQTQELLKQKDAQYKQWKQDIEQEHGTLKQLHQEQLVKMQVDYNAIRALLESEKSSHEDVMKQREQEFKDKLDSLKFDVENEYRIKFNTIQKDTAAIQQESEVLVHGLRLQLNELEDKLCVLQNNKNNLEQENNDLKMKVIEIQQSHESARSKVEELHTEIVQMQMKAENKLAELTEELNAKWAITLKDRENEIRHLLHGQIEKYKNIAAEELHMKETLISRLKNDSRSLEDRILRLQHDLDSVNKTAESTTTQKDAQLEQLKSSFQKDIQKMQEQHQLELERLREDHTAEKLQLEKKHFEDIESINAKALQQIAETSQSFDKRLQDINEKAHHKYESLSSLLEKQKAEYEQLKKSHETEINQLTARQMAMQQEFHAKVEIHVANSQVKEEKIVKLSKDIQRLEHSLSKNQKELEAKIQEVLDVRKDCHKLMKDREKQILLESQLKLETTKQEHDILLAAMKQDLHGRIQSHEQTIAQLQKQIEYLEYRYEHRESRPEDVDTIRTLSTETHELRKKLEQTRDELKYFKLELINREEAYNKVFSTSPKVGVMNVIGWSNKSAPASVTTMGTSPTRKSKSASTKAPSPSGHVTLPPLSPSSEKSLSPRRVISS